MPGTVDHVSVNSGLARSGLVGALPDLAYGTFGGPNAVGLPLHDRARRGNHVGAMAAPNESLHTDERSS